MKEYEYISEIMAMRRFGI